MKDYLEKYLQRELKIEEYKTDKMPLMFKGLYQLYLLSAESFQFVVAEPKQKVKLIDLKKHIIQLEQITNMNCAFCLESITSYIADSLLEMGIPFIIPNRQIYLPFTGIMIKTTRKRKNAFVQEISFLTQKIILSALYEKWQNMNVTKISECMGVTKAAVSKSLHEIEYLNIPILDSYGKNRVITINKDIKSLWSELQPALRNPIVKRLKFENDLKLDNRAGMSALSECSMINDNNYPTYGILKKNIKSLDTSKAIGLDNEIGCEILELGYLIDYKGKKIMDPFSIILSLTDEEKADERIQMAIDEMLEEYVW